jgi:hypothetical protein
VVAGGADVEADLVEDADGRLVLEQPDSGGLAPIMSPEWTSTVVPGLARLRSSR